MNLPINDGWDGWLDFRLQHGRSNSGHVLSTRLQVVEGLQHDPKDAWLRGSSIRSFSVREVYNIKVAGPKSTVALCYISQGSFMSCELYKRKWLHKSATRICTRFKCIMISRCKKQYFESRMYRCVSIKVPKQPLCAFRISFSHTGKPSSFPTSVLRQRDRSQRIGAPHSLLKYILTAYQALRPQPYREDAPSTSKTRILNPES